MNPSYSLVIPAHNEDRRIGRTLDAYLPVFCDSEIIVVLDGCTDRTTSLVLKAAARNPRLRAIQTEEASVVAPLFQASTLFTFLLGWFFLQEKLGWVQIAGAALVVDGGGLA